MHSSDVVGPSFIRVLNSILSLDIIKMEWNQVTKERSQNIIKHLQALDYEEGIEHLLDQRA